MAAGAFVLTFADERDFVRVASVLLGASYVSGDDAVAALNATEPLHSFGRVVAHRALPIPERLVPESE